VCKKCDKIKEENENLKIALKDVKKERDHYKIYIPEWMRT